MYKLGLDIHNRRIASIGIHRRRLVCKGGEKIHQIGRFGPYFANWVIGNSKASLDMPSAHVAAMVYCSTKRRFLLLRRKLLVDVLLVRRPVLTAIGTVAVHGEEISAGVNMHFTTHPDNMQDIELEGNALCKLQDGTPPWGCILTLTLTFTYQSNTEYWQLSFYSTSSNP